MRDIIVKIGSVICVMALFISCESFSANAATPQEGWYVLQDISNTDYRECKIVTIDNIDYVIINNFPYTTVSNYVDLKTVHFTQQNNGSTGNFRLYEKCYVGSSIYDWYIDSDWIILANVTSNANDIVFFDSNWFPYVQKGADVAGNDYSDDTFIYSKGWVSNGTMYSRMQNTAPSNVNILGYHYAYKLDYTINPQNNYSTYSAGGYYVNKININNFVCCLNKDDSTSRISLMFLCPYDKIPLQIQGGDSWPYVPPIDVNVISDTMNEWEQRQLTYSNTIRSLTGATLPNIITANYESTSALANEGLSLTPWEQEIGISLSDTTGLLSQFFWIPKILALMCGFGFVGLAIRRALHD